MDPIGFAFEHYDAAGRWRDIDGGQPVDATGDADRHRRRRPARRRPQPGGAPGRQRRGRELRGHAVVPLRLRPQPSRRSGDICTIGALAAALRARRAATSGRWCAQTVRMARVPQPPAGGVSHDADRLSRRTILRGAGGAAIALPWLEAMAPRRAQARAPAVKRFVVMFSPNGTLPAPWTPTGQRDRLHAVADPGAAGAAPGRHRRDRQGLEQQGGGGDGHQNGIGGMLTGQPAQRRPVRRRRRAARRLGDRALGRSAHRRGLAAPTQLRSLELGRAGRRGRQLGADDLPRRQPAAAARRRSGQRLRARVLRPAHRSRRCSRGCARGGSRSSTRVGAQYTRISGQPRQRRPAAPGRAPHRGARDRDAPDHRPGRRTTRPATIRRCRPCRRPGERRLPDGGRAADGSAGDGAGLRPHAGGVAAVVALGVADALHLARTSPRGTTICRTGRDTDADAVNKLTQINTWYAQQLAGLISRLKATPDGAAARCSTTR